MQIILKERDHGLITFKVSKISKTDVHEGDAVMALVEKRQLKT